MEYGMDGLLTDFRQLQLLFRKIKNGGYDGENACSIH